MSYPVPDLQSIAHEPEPVIVVGLDPQIPKKSMVTGIIMSPATNTNQSERRSEISHLKQYFREEYKENLHVACSERFIVDDNPEELVHTSSINFHCIHTCLFVLMI